MGTRRLGSGITCRVFPLGQEGGNLVLVLLFLLHLTEHVLLVWHCTKLVELSHLLLLELLVRHLLVLLRLELRNLFAGVLTRIRQHELELFLNFLLLHDRLELVHFAHVNPVVVWAFQVRMPHFDLRVAALVVLDLLTGDFLDFRLLWLFNLLDFVIVLMLGLARLIILVLVCVNNFEFVSQLLLLSLQSGHLFE